MRFEISSAQLASALALTFSLCLATAGVARADGGGGGGGGGSSDADRCGRAEYWSDRTNRCERLRAGVMSDKELAKYAVALSRAKRYDEALDALNLMQDRNSTVSLLPDADLAEYAITLAKAKRYDDALAVLNQIKDANTAVALNYRGYITRHLGRVDEGIGYYLRSVKLDPKYAQVREYLGEAYVIKGDLPRAKVQLAMIRSICGNTECEEYEDLNKAIATKIVED